MVTQEELFHEIRYVRNRVDQIHEQLPTKADREDVEKIETRVRETEKVAFAASSMGKITLVLLGIVTGLAGVLGIINKFLIEK